MEVNGTMMNEEVFFCIGVIDSGLESQFSITDNLEEAKLEIKKYGASYEYCYIEQGIDGEEDGRTVIYQSYSLDNPVIVR